MAFYSEEQKARDEALEKIKHLCQEIVKQHACNLTIGDIAWFISFIQYSDKCFGWPYEKLNEQIYDLENVLEQASGKGESK
jgi:hypothetical protein